MAQKSIYVSLVKAHSFRFAVHHCRWHKKGALVCYLWRIVKGHYLALLVGLLQEHGTTERGKEMHG